MIRAGTSMTDISPKAGTHLGGSGFGEHRPATTILDPLYAKALIIESGDRRICFLNLDVIVVTEEYTRQIREGAGQRFDLEPNAIMVHPTQSHSAPAVGNLMMDPDFPLDLPPELEYLRGSESFYCDMVVEKSLEVIGKAQANLRPVQFGAASGLRDRLAFNRRGVMRDGSISMPHPGIAELRYLEGPIDPEVGVCCFRTLEMEMVAMLLHYTCHPVNVFGTPSTYHAISSDWPGIWTKHMQDAYGEGCVPLVLNGCCGNVNPWDPFDPDFVSDHRRMGADLAEMSRRIIPSITDFRDEAVVDWRLRQVPLSYREVPRERMEEVNRILAENPTPRWKEDDPSTVDPDWFWAASTKSIEYCRKRSPKFLYEVQAFRIGDAAFVGLPGEPFVEGQLALKIASPAYPTYVAHMTSHYVGYLPTREAAVKGGHEANFHYTYWAKLAPDSLDTVVDNAVACIREMFPGTEGA